MGLSNLGSLHIRQATCPLGNLHCSALHSSLFQEFFSPRSRKESRREYLVLASPPAPVVCFSSPRQLQGRLPMCYPAHTASVGLVLLFFCFSSGIRQAKIHPGYCERKKPTSKKSSLLPTGLIPSRVSHSVHMGFTELHRPLMFWLLQTHARLLTSPSPPGPSCSSRHQTHSFPKSLCFCILLLCLEESSACRDVFFSFFSLCSLRASLGMPHEHRPGSLPSCSGPICSR